MGQTDESVRLERIVKLFDSVTAVDNVTLTIRPGEFVCLLGPSGCGKTTTLRIVAGFVEPDAGTVFINGMDVSHLPPNKRDIGMVYQNYALFPHMTVFDNVGFGLRMRGVPATVIAERVSQVLELVGLTGLEGRKSGQLSGGQQQRVALARAMVIQPTVLLLDEPLSNLDAKLRKRMQLELKALQRAVGITTIHVTHDQEEALTLADTVVILNQGRVEQIGGPREVYTEPRNVFVADFLGRSNFLGGRVKTCDREGQMLTFVTEHGEQLTIRDGGVVSPGTPAEAFIRPERIELRGQSMQQGENILSGEIKQIVFVGSMVNIDVLTVSGRVLTVDRPSGGPEEKFRPGDKVEVFLPAEALRLILESQDKGL